MASNVTHCKGAEGSIYFPGIATSLLKNSMMTLSCSSGTSLFLLEVITDFTWKHAKLQTFFKPEEAEAKQQRYSTNAALSVPLAKRLQPVSVLPSKSAHSSNPELKGLSLEGRGGSERPAGRVSRAARSIINHIKQTGRHKAKRKHLEQLRSASLRQRGSWQLR